MALKISNTVEIPDYEIEMSAIRAQGAGGQNVNKVSSAIHLRFDILQSSLPERIKEQLMLLKDSRISKEGVLVIKAQQYRTQEANREDALLRLQQLIQETCRPQKVRRPTKPSKSSQRKRVDAKKQRGAIKSQRQAKW
ncbi:Peptidyl-tRNA hydrolase ArfB [Marinomonas aquimarina]|uniref:Peptidyl-tRNA hydrolase ArfB n=1 Tax=Marinomonas aquimarina TaxID=295068 RepID=A0A1A8T9G1_9GAMM|nr:alternative ribosome rescue aminoacyl-tRNA hydrolase ArfB [Marinomonas aquimarina]SBS28627.1 Peptidyl-tRNA hydrolase ArfB [Marinomonas aquimarina]